MNSFSYATCFTLIGTSLFITACTTSSNRLTTSTANTSTPTTKSVTETTTEQPTEKTTAKTAKNTKQAKNTSSDTASQDHAPDHGLTQAFNTLVIATDSEPQQSSTTDWQWDLPPYFPQPRVPKDNPMSKAKVELGRHLFYDTRLSVNGTTSCASCHLQALAFTDGKARSLGATGKRHPRSSLSLANVAYLPTLNWANPAITKLEDQLLTPMFGELPVEMGLTDAHFKQVQTQFAKDKIYQKLFADAFGKHSTHGTDKHDKDDIGKQFSEPADYTLVEISQAIASFERSILSTNSKFDRHIQGKVKLSDSEMRGKMLFFGEKAECHHCHGSLTFNDQIIHSKSRSVPIRFHNTGMYNLDKDGSYLENNEGLFDITANIDDKGKFKAPSLRNVALTAPYNHDGSTKTLAEVVANYANGGRIIQATTDTDTSTTSNIAKKSAIMGDSEHHIGDGRFNPNKSDLIVRIDLNKQEQADIVDFLRTLTDESLLTNPNYANPWLDRDDAQ